jgi:hypothetical protein
MDLLWRGGIYTPAAQKSAGSDIWTQALPSFEAVAKLERRHCDAPTSSFRIRFAGRGSVPVSLSGALPTTVRGLVPSLRLYRLAQCQVQSLYGELG